MTDFQTQDERSEDFRLPGVPELRSADPSWERRLDDWHAMMRVRPHAELPEVLAGARGELSLRRVMGRHQSSRFGHIFGGKRVPRDPASPAAGRYEVDLIVVTPRRIAIIEVKHWSGTLRLDGNQWVYQRRSGEVQAFESLVAHNQNKVLALRHHLQVAGLDVPGERFSQLVVFSHPRLDLDERLAAHPNVVTLYDLQFSGARFGRGVSGRDVLLARLIERCAKPATASKLTEGLLEMMTPAMTARIAEVIGQLRTWDVVRLHGGRELIGDLLWVRVDGRRIDALPAGCQAALHWWRGKLWGLVPLAGLAPFGRLRGKLLATCSVGVDDCAYFHEAGRPRPSVIALPHVDELRTG